MSKKCCDTDINSCAQSGAPAAPGLDAAGSSEYVPAINKTGKSFPLQPFIPSAVSLLLLAAGLVWDYFLHPAWFTGNVRILFYLAAYLPVGLPVIRDMFIAIKEKDFFSEFTLMVIATAGAFAIGEYPEAAAVMLFYSIGETFQMLAVKRAKTNIQKLLDQRPEMITVREHSGARAIRAEEGKAGQIMLLKPGEKVGLDGELLSDKASFNTAALTGESKPDNKVKGDVVLAGMINLQSPAEVKITTAYSASKLSRILDFVKNTQSQKAPTELFIRKFAKIYTPVVVCLAVAICFVPYFFVEDYIFRQWLYRALIFLVISCPCALVISIPLGYFGGIGAASRNGILVKGGNFLDILAKVKNVVMDKTGTLTKGVFTVQEVHIQPKFDEHSVLMKVNGLERQSTHPIATAIREFAGKNGATAHFESMEEIAGYGLKGISQGKEWLAGSFRMLDKFNIRYDAIPGEIAETVVAVAADHEFAGYITIADEIKADAPLTIQRLKQLGVNTIMLSGDKQEVATFIARKLGVSQAFGGLLPEDKVNKIKELKARNQQVAFAGDGINDAPVVALSDVGIAMGGLGSDATIEIADVVIQDDRPSKIPVAIKIGRKTRQIVIQNILLAFSVKGVVLLLGAAGLATMWEAVFADVGVALLAILNAMRIQRMDFD